MRRGERPATAAERYGQAKRGAHRAVELGHVLVTASTVQVDGHAVFAVDRAEAAFQAGQAQATHLTVVQAAQQQAEQDAGVERPCSQRASVPGGFHGGESTIRMNGRVVLLLQVLRAVQATAISCGSGLVSR